MPRRLVAALGMYLAIMVGVLSPAVFAQVPDDWQVLRIFVPEEDVGTLVPNDYNPVEIEDLAGALAREATRRSQLHSSPHIAEALYVLRCSAENLISDQSRWSIKSPLLNASLNLEEVSVALRNSGATPADDRPLLPSLRFSPDGAASISKIPGDTNYWFGMSLGPTGSSGNQSIYDLRLPAATMSRMIISAPESIQIASPDVVVTQISNPRDYLPENWPVLATSEGQRWFVIHISGKSKFRLVTEVTERKDTLDFQHFVRRSSLAYSASEKGLIVSADFEVERLSATSALQILLDKSLRIRTATVNGAAAEYRMVPNNEDRSAFEIPMNSASGGNVRIRIEAVADTSFPFDGQLPTIEMPQSFSWEGKTSLVAEDALIGNQIEFLSRAESAKPRLETTTVGKRWVADWIGTPPRMRASISRISPTYKSDSFTRLTVQEDWIAATTNLHVNCSSLDSSELRLRVGSGWFIDDLTIEESDLPIVPHLPDGEAGDVILTWDRLSSEMSINLQLVAHFPKAADAEKFSLQAPRVVTVIGGVQKDHYAIEQTGRLQIEANPILQRLELSESELATWEIQLLSRLSTTQLFQGIGQSIPPIVMNRSSGTYAAKVVTIAKPLRDSFQATYSIEIVPTAGAIDTASCTLTMPPGVANPNWRVTQELNGEQIPVAKAIVNTTSIDAEIESRSEVRFDLQLPDAISNKFFMQCELQLPLQGLAVVNLPLVAIPSAIETRLILPRNFELDATSIGIISLPSNICCDSQEFASVLDKDADAMVGYRYDPSVISSVSLRPTALKLDRGAWIWSDSTVHRMYNDGRVTHEVDLKLFAPEDMTMVVNLPSEWVMNRISLDGIVSAGGQQVDSRRTLIQIPQGKLINLSMLASSQHEELGWFNQTKFSKPTYSLASLNSSDSLWLQPGRMSLSEIYRDAPISTAGRLSPTSWWKWLDPSPTASSSNESDSVGWRKLPLGEVRKSHPQHSTGLTTDDGEPGTEVSSSEVLLIDRSSLCAMCVAILLSGAGLCFWTIGDRIGLWWLCLTLSASVVLVIPAAYIDFAHLSLLCLIGGASARLIRIVTNPRTNPGSSLRRGSTIVRASSNVALILIVAWGGIVSHAQEALPDNPKGKFPLTYGVLIPLNSEGELSAKHVYAPRKLMNLLNNTDTLGHDEQKPQILGAKYMLKISGGTNSATYVQEFTAEFDLLFNSTELPIRLPVKSNQLQLLRGSVSGQGVLIPTRLSQSVDAITYRPPEAGRVRLRLQLTPTTNGNADRTRIEVDIPRIASSVLEVVADDTLDVNVKSIGLVRRLTATSWSAELGPTDALRVDWPTRPQRNPMPIQSVTQADTWLHISEGQVVADCQIRVNGARGLPKQLHVQVDAGWEPVGTDWNDAKLISSELSPVGNRRNYLVYRESSSDRAIIRVSMVPRNGQSVSTLAVPFLSLSESSFPSRTLALSTAGKPRWKLIGSEFWNRLNVMSNDLEWDSGKPTLNDLWRVPTGALSGSLQKVSADLATVDESSDLQLLSTKTTLDYRASWSQSTDAQVLQLEVPMAAVPQNVRLNGSDAEFQLSERAGKNYMLVNVARAPTEIRLLEIQMQLEPASSEVASLPRIVLKDAAVSRSLYQVSCGAELVCTLDNESLGVENRLKFASPIVDPTLMLEKLTSPVGVIDLANSYRDSAQLPMKYQVKKRSPVNVVANVMALSRTEQGWRASVELLISAEKSTEFVFLDIPTSIRDSIESSGSPYRVAPSGAAGRSTLCLIPQVAENGMSRAKFDFRLPALGSSQSLAVPDIFLLGKEVSRPVLALPTKIDAQPVRWLRAGRRLSDEWPSKSGLTLAVDDYVFFEMSESQQQMTWRPSETDSHSAEVLFAWAVIDEDSDGHTIGAVNYWIDPNNHLDLALELPTNAQLIGIQSGTNGAVWHSDKLGSVRILMQPNYLPVQIRVLIRWPKSAYIAGDMDSFRIRLPTIGASGLNQMPIAVLGKAKLESVAMNDDPAIVDDSQVRKLMVASQVDAILADRWSKLLLKSLPVVSDLREDEVAGWIRNWNPEAVGLQGFQALAETSGTSDSERDTVSRFWNWYLDQTTASKSELRDEGQEDLDSRTRVPVDSESEALHAIDFNSSVASSISDLPSANADWYLVDFPGQRAKSAMDLQFDFDKQEQPITSLAIATALLGVSSGLLLLIFHRLRDRTNELLAIQPWLYWAFLAALTWLLVPVAWPSVVIALTSVGMLASQLIGSRRRQLAMRR